MLACSPAAQTPSALGDSAVHNGADFREFDLGGRSPSMLRVNEAAPLRSENLAIHEGGNGAAGGRAGRKKPHAQGRRLARRRVGTASAAVGGGRIRPSPTGSTAGNRRKDPTRNFGAWGTLLKNGGQRRGRTAGAGEKAPRARAASGAKTRGDGNGGRRGRANAALPYKVNGADSKKKPHAQLRRMGHPFEKRGRRRGRTENADSSADASE